MGNRGCYYEQLCDQSIKSCIWSQDPNKPVENHESIRTIGYLLCQTRNDGGLRGQMWWQNTVKPHCTDPPLNFGSSACCSHVCPLGFLSCSGWSRGHPGLLKGFLSVCELLYRKKWHFVKQQILSTVLIFSLLSHLDIEIRSITFIEDASYEKSAGEDIFHACLLFRIKLLNQSCSYQVGMSFNN